MPFPNRSIRAAAFALSAVVALAACAAMPPASTLATGAQATIEGSVRSVDTAPWAYDGNAVVVVATAAGGDVAVNLPARWNLCKAGPVEGVQDFAPGDRVRATGTVTAPGVLSVCERAEHALVRLK